LRIAAGGAQNYIMRILITVVGSDGVDRERDLYDWLLADADLRPWVHRDQELPAPGTLGPVLGVLTVAVGSGGVLSVLAGALGAWLAQARNQKVSVRLQEGKDKERIVQLEARNVKTADIERMLKLLISSQETSGQDDALTQ
jgi:muramoyltetrapeptide carboxypeptidase LdcA involved in peptidoglycan recycling